MCPNCVVAFFCTLLFTNLIVLSLISLGQNVPQSPSYLLLTLFIINLIVLSMILLGDEFLALVLVLLYVNFSISRKQFNAKLILISTLYAIDVSYTCNYSVLCFKTKVINHH